MTGTTITGTVATSLVLETGAYGAALTINYGALLQPAKPGPSVVTGPGQNESIFNFGTISADSGVATSSPGGNGVSMYGEGTVDNAGLIEGGSSGLNNQSPAEGGSGVDLQSFGLVANAGTIIGGGGGGGTDIAANGGFGLYLQGGGRVVNTGSLAGGQAGTDALGGGEGGTGLMLSKSTEVMNTGLIQAGAGAPVTRVGEQTNSEPAVEFQSAGELLNAGTIGQQGIDSIGVLSVGSIALDNFGTIFGLDVLGGGTLVNAGVIFGENGLTSIQGLSSSGSVGIALNSAASLVNSGSISGGNGYSGGNFGGAAGGAGVLLGASGGYLLNKGSICGGAGSAINNGAGGAGVVLQNFNTVINQGQITGGDGAYGEGVELNLGLLINMGTISGGGSAAAPGALSAGVDVSSGILIAQAGTIEGGASNGSASSQGFAVEFGNTAPGTLVVNPNATFIGGIEASSVAQDSLILSGSSNGTLGGFGAASGINNFSKIFETAGAHWNLQGTISAASIAFEGSSWLELACVTGQSTVDFASTGSDQLDVGIPEDFKAVLNGFSISDSILLNGVIGESLLYKQNKLYIFGSNGEIEANLSIRGNYVISDFVLKTSADSTEVTLRETGSLIPTLHS